MDRPRVVVAEDHAGIAEQLRELLEPEFGVVATVADGHALLRAVDGARPDGVVTDIARRLERYASPNARGSRH
jgi:CheY-like chemotaxis protein